MKISSSQSMQAYLAGVTTQAVSSIIEQNMLDTGSVVNIQSGETIDFGGTDSITWAGMVSGTGGLVRSDSGATVLTGINTYTGNTTITSGTLKIGGSGSLGGGSYSATISNSGTLQFASSAAQTLSGPITGDIQVAGDISTVTTITLGQSANSNAVSGNIILGYDCNATTNYGQGCIFSLGANEQISDTSLLSLSAAGYGGPAIFALMGHNQILAGAFTQDGSDAFQAVIKNGSSSSISTLTLNVASGHTYSLDGWGVLGPFPPNRYYDSSFTSLQDGGSQPLNLVKNGAGEQILASSNSYSGTTTISGGTLTIGNNGNLGSGTYAAAISVASGTTFQYKSSSNQTLSGVISGAGGLTKNAGTGTYAGASTLLLNGTNTYSGATAINAGSLGGSGSSSSSAHSIASGVHLFGGTGSGNSGTYTCGTLAFSSGAILDVYSAGGATASKITSGTVTGSGTVTVNLNQAMSGLTTYTLIANTGATPSGITWTMGTNSSGHGISSGPVWVAGVGLQITLLI